MQTTYCLRLTLSVIFTLSIFSLSAQSKLWEPTSMNVEKHAEDIMPELPEQVDNKKLFKLSVNRMIETTALAKSEGNTASTTIIDLPLPNGQFQSFKVWESSLMEKGLQEKYSEIRTYLIQGIDDPTMNGRMMISPYEFSAYFASASSGQEVFVRKVYKGRSNTYVSFAARDIPLNTDWVCGYVEEEYGSKHDHKHLEKSTTTLTTGDQLRLFRLAITMQGATSEFNGYTTKAEALAGIVSFLSEINTVYERDLSIRFVMPENADDIIFVDDATDPFTTNGGNLSLTENQVVQRQYIGLENYDLGFIFVLGGCCGAQGRVCTDARERSMNRFRDLQVTCHEIGHQFSASHSFSRCGDRSDGGNEVGSGTTIMSYITSSCGSTTIPNPGSITYFSARSRDQILEYIDQSVTCGTTLQTANTAPSITVPASGFYIPKETPYVLSGTGSDPNNSSITYSWEQNNPIAPGLDPAVDPVPADGDVPLQRPFNPTFSPERFFPSLELILSNTTSNYERLPTYSRSLTYQLYARDNQVGAGGTIAKEVSFEVDGTAGPFEVTSQNICSDLMAGSSQSVTWNVANTDNANVNVQTVNILLSIDGGHTWEYTLANGTANDGSETVTLPSGICTDQARIKVEAVGNIFFSINEVNFVIEDASNMVQIPKVLSFDGIDDKVEINTTLGNFGTSDFSVEATFKTSKNSGAIIAKREICSFGSFWNLVIHSSGTLRAEIFGSGGNRTLESTTIITDGEWHHAALTRESGTLKLYIDGTEEDTDMATADVNNTSILTLGTSVCNLYFEGELSDIRLWSKALSTMEVSDYVTCRPASTSMDLLASYSLQGMQCADCSAGSSTALEDATTNNNDGTLINGVSTINSDLYLGACSACSNIVSITSNPSNVNVSIGATASFSVVATGNNLYYQWQVSTDNGITFEDIASSNETTISFTAEVQDNDKQYRCAVISDCDVQFSTAATLNVSCNALSLSPITGPSTPCENNYYTYHVAPNAEVATWTWTAPSGWELTLFDNMVFVKVGSGSGNISVTVTDYCGTMDTEIFAVNPVLVEINSQPASQTVTEGTAVAMTVSVSSGGGTTSYIWQQSLDGGATFIDITNTNSAIYNITSAALIQDDRQYRCVVENSCLRDTSDVATLTVNCASSAPNITSNIQGANNICGNVTLTYSIAPVPGATTYNWTLPSGWTGTSSTNSISVTANGTSGTLTVSATNACGTSNVVPLEIIANSNACNNAINFDGEDDYLTAAQNAQYLDDDMTVSFWMKPDRLDGFQTLLLNGTEFEILLDGSQVVYRHNRYGSDYDDAVDITFNNAAFNTVDWHHIGLVRDSSDREISLYINGALVETDQWNTDFPASPDDNVDVPLIFGAGANGLINHFDGSLDEVKIWSEERTATQIQEDRYCEPVGTETNLLAYYDFNVGQANGNNTGITSISNAASAYPAASINNMSMNGLESNIVNATKGSAIQGNSFFCSAGEQLDFSIDLPGTPAVTWTLPSGWTGTSSTETITATVGASGGLVIAEATLSCGTVRLEKMVSSISPEGPDQIIGDNALIFNGIDDGLSLNTQGIAGTAFTLETWIKRNTAGSFQPIVNQGSSQSNQELLIRFEPSNSVRFSFFNNDLVTNLAYPELDWHHWAFVYDPSISSPNDNRFIYRDGILIDSDRTEDALNASGLLDIGKQGSLFSFDGSLDEFRIWNTARSQAEIQANLYCPVECINDDLELYLPFNEGTADSDNTVFIDTKDYSLNDYEIDLSNFDLTGTTSNFTNGVNIALYEDNDMDGFGSSTIWTCGSTADYVSNNIDCNDNLASVNPTTSDICGNSIDDNCNGVVDENTLFLNLEGTDDNLNLGNNLGNFGSNDFTIEARIRTTKKDHYLMSKRLTCNASNSFWNIVILNTGEIRVELYSGSGNGPGFGYTAGGTDVADGQWHHIAITRKSGTVTIYDDGIEVGSTFNEAILNNTANLEIGPNVCTSGSRNYEGDIDEVRIWTIARTATEIDTYKDASLPNTLANLEAYYDFNNPNAEGGTNNSGETTVTDRMGNHNGTLTNFALSGSTSNWIGNPGCFACSVMATLSNDSPVCTGEAITFTALPANASSYQFFNDIDMNGEVDMGEELQNNGSDTYSSSTLSDGDVISVLVEGCGLATSAVTINALPNLVITDPAAVCAPNTVDLTASAVTAGSDAGTLAYFTDAGLTNTLSSPNAVTTSGTYYIELTDANGCSSSEVVNVVINALPNLVITDPAAVCTPNTVDLTNAAVTAGSDAGTLAYFTDAGLTNTLSSPNAVNASGTYYIELTDANGCSSSEAVNVVINTLPNLVVTDPTAVCAPNTIDLTDGAVTTGSDAGTFAYFTDAGLTNTLSSPNAVTTSGTYYIELTDANGCSSSAAVNVVIHPLPNLVITDPAGVCTPNTIDLTAPAVTAGSDAGTLAYFTDAGLTNTLSSPNTVTTSGTYYIKLTEANGCSSSEAVNVIINLLPNLVITDPAAVCSPNTIDLTASSVTSGSDAGTFAYFTDVALTNTLGSPNAVNTSGTYYIELTDANGCSSSEAVNVVINSLPSLVITDPAAVCAPNTIDLTNGAVTAGSDAGTFTYFTDAGLTNTLSSPNAVTISGTYYIELTDANGCSSSEEVNIVINATPDIASIGTQMNPCPATSLELTNLTITDNNNVSGTITTFHSAMPSSATDLTNQLASTEITSDQTVYVMIANTTTGCFDVESFLVDIEDCCPDLSAVPNALSISSESNCVSNCELSGGAWALNGSACPAGSKLQSFPDATTTTGGTDMTSAPTYNQNTAETYHVRCVCEENDTQLSPVQTVTSNPNICMPPTVALSNDSPVCAGETITFTASLGLSNYEFFNDLDADGEVDMGESLQSSSSNTYSSNTLNDGDEISVLVTDVNGCTAVATSIVSINDFEIPSNVLDFDGANDRVELGNFSFYQDDFTIEGWINSTDNSRGAFLVHVTQGGQTAIGLQRSGNSVSLVVRNPPSSAGGVFVVGTSEVFDGEWHHFAAVKRSDNRVYLYLDGVQEGVTSAIGDFGANVYDVILGYNAPASARYFDGQMDEIRLWDVARSETEIQDNRYQELTGTESGLVAYYNFNQGVSEGDNTGISSLLDATANAHDGNFINFALNGSSSNFMATSEISSSISLALSNDGPICLGEALTFTATTGADTYEFFNDVDMDGEVDMGESLQSSSSNIYSSNTLNDGDEISVLVTNANGCTAIATSIVEINQLKLATTVLNFKPQNPQDYIVSSATGLPQGNAARTMECWIKTSQTSIGNFISWGSNAVQQRNSMAVRNGKLAYIGQSLDRIGNIDIRDNQWHHVALSYDGSTMYFYVDGMLDVSWNVSNINTTGQNLRIGKNVIGRNDEYYDGFIDEVRIWGYARTQAEIQATKDQQLSGNESSLLVYYNFEEGVPDEDNTTITTVIDQTPNGFNGTLTGFDLMNSISNYTNATPNLLLEGGIMSLSNDSPVCAGENLTFTASLGLSNYEFFNDLDADGEVDMGESLQSSSANTYSSNTLNDGDEISVLVTDTNGCTAVATSTVTINDLPTLVITDPAAVCSPNAVDLTDAAITTGSDVGTFAYFTDTGLTNTLSSPDAVTTSGTYYIELTDANGCSTSEVVNVVINPFPSIDTQPSDQSVCEGYNATFSIAASGIGLTYQWQTTCEASTYNNSSGDGFPGSDVKGVDVAADGTIYAAHWFGNGLAVLAPNATTWTVYDANSGNGFPSNSGIMNMQNVHITNGDIYAPFYNGGGIAVLEAGAITWTNYTTSNGLPGNNVFDVHTVGDDIYAALWGQGIAHLPSGSSTWTLTSFPGSNNLARDIDDDDGTIYLALANSGGLAYLPSGSSTWMSYKTGNGDNFPSNSVYCVHAENGELYLGTNGGGIAHLPSGSSTWTVYNTSDGNGLPSNIVNGIYVSNGTIYAATNGGLAILADGETTWTVYNTSSGIGFPSNTVNNVKEQNGTIYAATSSGLFVLPSGEDIMGASSSTYTINNATASDTNCNYQVLVTNQDGCSILSNAVSLTVNPLPNLVITDPAAVCAPSTIDLTGAAITTGSDAGNLAYFTDAALMNTLSAPDMVNASGTYYIELTDANGCSNSEAVNVVINALPTLVVTDPAAVCAPNTIDLTAAAITTGSDAGNLAYFTDATLMNTLSAPDMVNASGTYYIELTDANGCSSSAAVNVVINPTPDIEPLGTQMNVCPATSVILSNLNIVNNNPMNGTIGTFHSATPTSATDMSNQLTDLEITSDQFVYVMIAQPATGCFDVEGFMVEIVDCCPDLSATPNALSISSESSCVSNCELSGGAWALNTSTCPAGSKLQSFPNASTTTGGIDMTSAPAYNQTMAETYHVRCICEDDDTQVSPVQTITSSPGTCTIPSITLSNDGPAAAGVNVIFTATMGLSNYEFFDDMDMDGEVDGGESLQNSASNTYTTNTLSDGDIISVLATDTNGCTVLATSTVSILSCPTTLTITNDPVASGIYRASTIETVSNGTVNILSGADVDFLAEQSITLKAGFHAQANSDFLARIEACPANGNSEAIVEQRLEQQEKENDLFNVELNIKPNPTRTDINLSIYLSRNESINILLLNVNGKVVKTISQMNAIQGWNNITIQRGHLPDGLYFISLQTAERKLTERVILAH